MAKKQKEANQIKKNKKKHTHTYYFNNQPIQSHTHCYILKFFFIQVSNIEALNKYALLIYLLFMLKPD